jgi:(p)ppGpp synthase/HD superfamily hydrolase
MAIAQTNLQLYNQLLRLNYSHGNLGDLRATYELARELFSGLFRPSGKTFIAHVIGTASILADCLVDIEVVKAGLMHAAYAGGDFGDGQKGVSGFKREQLIKTTGSRTEEIVHAYSLLQWPPEHADDYRSLVFSDPATKDAALVRLANELEEYIDLGVCYSNERARKRIALDQPLQNTLMDMAKNFDYPDLVTALADAFQNTSCAKVPDVARSQQLSGQSVLIPPRTYQKLMQMVISRVGKKI